MTATTEMDVIGRAKKELKLRQGQARERLELLISEVEVAAELARPRVNESMRPSVKAGSVERAKHWQTKLKTRLLWLRQELGEVKHAENLTTNRTTKLKGK